MPLEPASESDIQLTIQFCNKIRGMQDEQHLEDLIAGEPFSSQNCVVAKSVNCELSITKDDDWDPHAGAIRKVWVLTGDGEELLEQIAQEFHLERRNRAALYLKLPCYVARVAQSFDDGDLPQYEQQPIINEKETA